ncbi:hypothetical protein [Alicyclobacillus cellulosilyticus]|uniref:hypothetical protein n=1 Tax=Alicyclobacillus cellulosilyticus TaxID=1003997 RepID=UPI001667E1AE|nr:hypothetical protein [Alicyclobacillus cellulosilyticus]
MLNPPPGIRFTSVDFVDVRHGFVAGLMQAAGRTTSALWVTTDGGRTFRQVLPVPYPVGPMSFVSARTGFGAEDVTDRGVTVSG